jgi:hypothetical protein
MSLKTIERYHGLICRSLFRNDSSLSYDRTLLAIKNLVMALENTETDESVWYIGELSDATLGDLIVGSYWFLIDYHGGQSSLAYNVASILSGIDNPGCTNKPEPDSPEQMVYDALKTKLVK